MHSDILSRPTSEGRVTVCVGALCCNAAGKKSKAVVVASDRMVTVAGMTEFEPETPKVIRLTERMVALSAGDALKGAAVIQATRSALPADNPTVQAVSEEASRHYAVLRARQIEAQFFAPRGISMGEFYRGLQAHLLPQLAATLDAQVSQFDYGVELLIAGADDSGAHLFYVGNPGGQAWDLTPIAFGAIGSGALHATQSLIGFKHTSAKALDETIFEVYLSKKRGEAAPGVGNETDLLVITEDGCVTATEADLKELDAIVEEYQKPAGDILKKRLEKLKLAKGGHDAASNA